ncbi:leucine ABC transporter substrate-binding protein [Halorubrum salipaludis]|uniref:Leucine ABC transporter substrate-binding protein n=1 Tax=Halorubrum salipaludis TaxID=2032630 RepID=A0A2A2FDG8_9EURY|nr:MULTISPECIES: ABC transporter substrate-binding protein [Halorubrum]PAU83008.1 leucine ABC transporter substrate-binding protein [Halorubrum salipaludis]
MTNDITRSSNRRQFLKATGAGTGVAALAGCLVGDSGGDGGDGSDDEPIVVAGLQPYSGPFALYGDTHTSGIEYAFEEVNADGGVEGRELEHNAIDTESDPGEASSILTSEVESEDAVAAVGPVSSDVGVTAAQTAEDLEVPLFLHAAGDIDILSRDSRYTFRTALPPAPAFIRGVAGIIDDRGFDTVGAINGDYAWGIAAETAIEREFPESLDLTMSMAPAGESDFVPYLRDMPDDLEILVGSGHPPGLNDMYRQMLEVDLEPEVFTAAVSPPESNYGAIGDDVAEGFLFGHLPDVYSEEYQSIAEEFYEETGEYFGPTQAVGYVTGHLIAEGLRQADEVSRQALSDAMRDIEFDTIYANPIQYTEWGELDQYELIWSGFELEAPDYYPDGDFDLVEEFRTESLDAVDPEDY